MLTALVETPWVGSGASGDPYRPLLGDEFSVTWVDVTGLPVAEIPQAESGTVRVTASEDTITAILLDERFTVSDIEEVADDAS